MGPDPVAGFSGRKSLRFTKSARKEADPRDGGEFETTVERVETERSSKLGCRRR